MLSRTKPKYGKHCRKQQWFWQTGTLSSPWLKKCILAAKGPTDIAMVMFSIWYRITKGEICITRMNSGSIPEHFGKYPQYY